MTWPPCFVCGNTIGPCEHPPAYLYPEEETMDPMQSHYHQDRTCRHGAVLRYDEACPRCKAEREQAAEDYRHGRINATEFTDIIRPNYTNKVQPQLGYDATWSD